jgi:hypothetical protein
MTPEERAELDRLLDLAEKEQILAAAPTPAQEKLQASPLLLEQAQLLENEFAQVRATRQALAPSAEWVD